MQRGSMQDRAGKAFKLKSIDMRVCAEYSMVLPITHAEALHFTGAQIPGVEGFANHAAILSVDLKALMPVHAHRHRQIKVTHTAISKCGANKPAESAKFLDEHGLHAHDFSSQEASGIDEMAAMTQEIVARLVRFWMAGRPPGVSAAEQERLKVVRHRVAIGRVAVPGFEGEQLSQLLLDELAGEGYARVEALHCPHL